MTSRRGSPNALFYNNAVSAVELGVIYDPKFYAATGKGSSIAARRILPLLWRCRQFNSVIDVGCGTGTWLQVASDLGANRISGIEGAHIPDEILLISPQAMVRSDLCQRFQTGQTFDLCLCLELAEHLPPERGVSLVEDLTALSRIIVFSAAIPFQGGSGHLNEMWPEYWAGLFANHGYLVWTGPRSMIWNDRSVPWWYRQNLLVFVHESEWAALLPEHRPADPRQLTAIHPESYLWSIRRKNGSLMTSFDFDVELYYSCWRGDCEQHGAYGPEFSALAPEPVV